MIIAVNMGFWHHGYHRQVTMGVLSYAAAHRDVQLYLPDAGGDGALFVPQEEPERIDGVIGQVGKYEYLPAVDVFERPRPGMPHITTDHRAIARMAFEHFRERGLRHLAVLDSARFSGVRCGPFVDVCQEHGFIPDIFRFGGREVVETKAAQHKRLVRQLKGLPKPAGLFLTLDNHGPDLLKFCEEAGVRVPQDLAVLGVNNDMDYCLACKPALSSIDPSGERIGYQAMETLVGMIRGADAPEEVLIHPREVVTRESTNVILDEHPNVTQALDYLHMNISEPVEVEDLLGCQTLGRRALEKKFRSDCGMSIKQYLLRLRLQKIRHLLETTDLHVVDIGRRCGIPDPAYLGLLFRRKYGLTPLEHRRRHQHEPVVCR